MDEFTDRELKQLSEERKKEPEGTGGWPGVPIIVLIVAKSLPDGILQSTAFTREMMANPELINDTVWSKNRHIIWIIFFARKLLSISAGLALWKIHRLAPVQYARIILRIKGSGIWFCLSDIFLPYPCTSQEYPVCRVRQLCCSSEQAI